MMCSDGYFIPIGKAITPVETDNTDFTACYDCFFTQECQFTGIYDCFLYTADRREDGKNVVFKLIDLP